MKSGASATPYAAAYVRKNKGPGLSLSQKKTEHPRQGKGSHPFLHVRVDDCYVNRLLLAHLKHPFPPAASPPLSWVRKITLPRAIKGKVAKGETSRCPPFRIFLQQYDVLCVKVWLPLLEKVASVSEGWAGKLGVAWPISEEGEGRRFPATFRQSGLAAPARALLALLLLSGRIASVSPAPPPPPSTHIRPANLALTATRSGAEGLES